MLLSFCCIASYFFCLQFIAYIAPFSGWEGRVYYRGNSWQVADQHRLLSVLHKDDFSLMAVHITPHNWQIWWRLHWQTAVTLHILYWLLIQDTFQSVCSMVYFEKLNDEEIGERSFSSLTGLPLVHKWTAGLFLQFQHHPVSVCLLTIFACPCFLYLLLVKLAHKASLSQLSALLQDRIKTICHSWGGSLPIDMSRLECWFLSTLLNRRLTTRA